MTDISKVGDVAFFGRGDEGYFEEESKPQVRGFDARLLQEPISVVSTRAPLLFSEDASTSAAMKAMQSEHSGVVLITRDGSAQSAAGCTQRLELRWRPLPPASSVALTRSHPPAMVQACSRSSARRSPIFSSARCVPDNW